MYKIYIIRPVFSTVFINHLKHLTILQIRHKIVFNFVYYVRSKKMNRRTIFWTIFIFFLTASSLLAAKVIPDAELEKITGQTGIVLNVVLDTLIGDNYNQLSAEEKAKVRQMMADTLGPLSETEMDQIINAHLLFTEMLQQLPEEDRRKIEEAYEVITAQLKTAAPADLLGMPDGSELTADNLDDWATDKVNKILIAQQIINDMINALSSDQYQQMMDVQVIINDHLDALKK